MPLVIDKWFSLQATIPQPDTLDKVKAAHRTPRVLARQSQPRARADRRLRAGNPTQFNRADGAGYDFVADTVLALDPKNPQTGRAHGDRVPHLAHAGSRPPRQGGSRACSASRRDAGDLSRDLADIVERALAAPKWR